MCSKAHQLHLHIQSMIEEPPTDRAADKVLHLPPQRSAKGLSARFTPLCPTPRTPLRAELSSSSPRRTARPASENQSCSDRGKQNGKGKRTNTGVRPPDKYWGPNPVPCGPRGRPTVSLAGRTRLAYVYSCALRLGLRGRTPQPTTKWSRYQKPPFFALNARLLGPKFTPAPPRAQPRGKTSQRVKDPQPLSY